MRALIPTLCVLFGGMLNGQTTRSLEICGVPFHLGMTREQVKQKLALPPMTAEQRDEFIQTVLSGDTILLSRTFFGLPDTSVCYGTLSLKQDRVVVVQKTLSSTTDAVSLMHALFLELRKMTESKGTAATVKAWNYDENGMSAQFIRFSFGEEAIQIDAEDGKIGANKIGPTASIYVVLSR